MKKFRTVIVIDSEVKPERWSLDNYYWAVENNEAEVVSETTTKITPKPEPFATYPVYMRNWIFWKDEQTGEPMLSCVDARDSNCVYVRPVHSIHDPGIMSKADFETRYGDSVRNGKK